jgi:hypothetical protein
MGAQFDEPPRTTDHLGQHEHCDANRLACEYRAALLAMKCGKHASPEVNARRVCLHNELNEAFALSIAPMPALPSDK